MFDYQAQRPVALPDSIRSKIDEIEGRSAG
jgi:hypothetical protein